jgi:hypothetical protein
VEFGDRRVRLHAFGLIHGDVHGRAQLAQPRGDLAVAAGKAGAAVEHEHDGVGLGHGLLGLAHHLDIDALLRARLEAAGVDGDEGAIAHAAFAVVPVAGHAGNVVHDRVAAAGEPVEKGRLADVRAADERDHRLHSASATSVPSWVWMSRLDARASGAARTGPPPLE